LDDSYEKLGKVYVAKTIKVAIDNGVFIKLKNLHNRQVFVEIGLQGDPIVINPDIITKNDHFSLPAQKISAIH
jgi:hypothetical protein